MNEIAHDAEWYILEAGLSGARTAGVMKPTGSPPQCAKSTAGIPDSIPIMRDDMTFDEVGFSHVRQKMRGLETPEINRLALESA